MTKITLQENLYSTHPDLGVFLGIPAGTEISWDGESSVVVYTNTKVKQTYTININSRKFKTRGDDVKTLGIEKTQGKFVGVHEKTSIDVVEKYMDVHKDKVKFIRFFNIVKDVLLKVYKRNIVLNNSIMTLDNTKVSHLTLLDTVEGFDDIEYGSRTYIGLVADTAEYMNAYMDFLYLGYGASRKIEFSSSLLAMSSSTPMLPVISATLKI